MLAQLQPCVRDRANARAKVIPEDVQTPRSDAVPEVPVPPGLASGEGIDTQHVLPYGSVADVEEEVRQRIRDLASGGGYVVAAVHSIQPNVPPRNVVAMAEAARKHGRYPVAT